MRKEQAAGPVRRVMKKVAEDTLKILEKDGKVPLRPTELEGIELEVVVENQWPRQMAIATGMEVWPALADLEVMLLKSNSRGILLPDEGVLQDNRLAARPGSPHAIGSMGTCVMLPVGPEYCVVWFDWVVFRRTSPGKIHQMTEEEELELGAKAILQSERLTYFEEGQVATRWCIECAKHTWKVQQSDDRWRPIPGLATPNGDKWDEMESDVIGVPPRPHIARVRQRQRMQDNEKESKATPDEFYKAIMTELERQCPGILDSLNKGR